MVGNAERPLGSHPEVELLKVEGSPIIKEIDVVGHLSNLSKNQFLVYSPTAVHLLPLEGLNPNLSTLSADGASIALDELQRIQIPQRCDEITVFGAGRAIDIAKYLASMTGRNLDIIPSLLSTNAFGTPFGCYEGSIEDKTKITVNTGYADAILVDFEYLEKLGAGSLYGLADVLSIGTALHDWDMAIVQDPSVQDHQIYELARKIYDDCFRQIETGRLDIRTVFTLILNSAFVTGLHGSGRPESGSEHIFSKFIELDALRKGSYIMHGKSVGLGMVLMSTLQKNKNRQEIFNAVRNFGFLNEFEGDKDNLKRIATEVLQQIEPHPVRYSIVNEQRDNLKNPGFSRELSEAVIEELFLSR